MRLLSRLTLTNLARTDQGKRISQQKSGFVMATTKDEMKSHQQQYHALLTKANASLREGDYFGAIETAAASFAYIAGMMQYERKYEEKEFESVEAIELVLRFAPLVFDRLNLDKLEALLRSQKRIDRDASDDLAVKVAEAKARMWEARRLWDHLERYPDAMQSEIRGALGGDQTNWRSLVEAWEDMGLVRRTPAGSSYRLTLHTRLDELAAAKCPSCGIVARAPKAKFLVPQVCPKCRERTLFVILPSRPAAIIKE